MSAVSIAAFFDPPSWTLTYVAWDSVTGDAVVIDPVLDFDLTTRFTSINSVSRLSRFIRRKSLRLHWILETHAHADHLSGARELRVLEPSAHWGIGERLEEVFSTFAKLMAWPRSLTIHHLGVDRWIADGEEFSAGSLRISAIATPGHTPACVTYRVGPYLFTGDALFNVDSGVGRCDFPGGSATQLYRSIWDRIYSFPDQFVSLPGHDYQPGGRPVQYRSILGDQKRHNIHLKSSTTREEFVRFREARDKTLSAPRLLEPSLDWNLGAHQIVSAPNQAEGKGIDRPR